jgi:hypothetical protein
MRYILQKRLVSFQASHEAVVEYMYLDSKFLVTVGIGFLIDSPDSAIRLGVVSTDMLPQSLYNMHFQ